MRVATDQASFDWKGQFGKPDQLTPRDGVAQSRRAPEPCATFRPLLESANERLLF